MADRPTLSAVVAGDFVILGEGATGSDVKQHQAFIKAEREAFVEVRR